VNEDEMGGACSTNGEKRNACTVFGGKAGKKKTTRKRGMDWINVAHDRDQWRALVNTVMYLRVP
jgi:hypothetical protein